MQAGEPSAPTGDAKSVPVEMQQALAAEKARTHDLAVELKTLMDKFLKLKADQDASVTSSPDRLWRALPDTFKNQIHEIREGHLAKTTMTAKLDKAKEEVTALKFKVKNFEETKAELEATKFELERAKAAHRTCVCFCWRATGNWHLV